MRSSRRIRPLVRQLVMLFSLCLLPSLAHAHVGAGETGGLLHGMAHPMTGFDHMLAMVAIGLWAAQCGGRALWLVPLSFVMAMALGGLAGAMGWAIPLIEPGIIASVLILGLLVAGMVRLPLVAASAIAGIFAVLHGHAHGAEMPETVAGLSYGLGFILSTAVLHGAGISAGLLTRSMPQLLRCAGGAIAASGLLLIII